MTNRIALIPAYEPGETLLDLLRCARDAGLAAIVVDDGSGPVYSELFLRAAAAAVVLTHEVNRGKGCALKTGLRYIQDHFTSPYVVVTMDADGQHQVGDALRVCALAEQKPGALALGSRRLKDNVPLRSRFGNTVTRLVYRAATGLGIYDTQTGLRAFSDALAPALLKIPGDRYEYEMNVLLQLAREKTPIEEVEISTIYFDNNAGSHFNTLRDSYRIYKEILKYSASSLACFLVDYGLYSLFIAAAGRLGWAAGLQLSNILARLLSASFNFTINRALVFKSQKNIWKSATQYFILAAAILLGNTLVLGALVQQLGMNQYWAKLLTELLFFAISWLVQHFFIFNAGKEAATP